MRTLDLPYIPNTYIERRQALLSVHHARIEDIETVQWIEELAGQALAFVQRETGFSPVRQLHICIYHSNAEARQQLERDVPPTMAMAPYSDETVGVIVLHAPAAHPSNKDAARMLRLLAHEITHQFVAESTGSTKILGDGNRNMRVSTWLNEGYAETLGCGAIGATDRLQAMHAEFCNADNYHSFNVLSDCLDGLDHPAREDAFDHVTAAVGMLASSIGTHAVFQHLVEIDRSMALDEACTPERILLPMPPRSLE